MSQRVRSHRRIADGPLSALATTVSLALLFACVVGAKVGVQFGAPPLLARLGIGGLEVVAGVALLLLLRAGHRSLRRRLADRAMRRWVARSSFSPAAPAADWPWAPLLRAPDMATVVRAYDGQVDGHPVTAGEIIWIDNGLGSAVDRWEGRGVFVVVRPRRPLPAAAVRVYRELPSERDGEDQFRRRFRTIAGDAAGTAMLADPVLRAAHVRGEVPPWTLAGGRLFAFVPLDGPLTPAAIEDAARRTVRLLHLLRADPRG